MRRRTFAFALGSLFLITFHLVQAQQQVTLRRIGVISISRCGVDHNMKAFLQGLRELGYEQGKNFAIECLGAGIKLARLPKLAAELVRQEVDVIVTRSGIQHAALSRLQAQFL